MELILVLAVALGLVAYGGRLMAGLDRFLGKASPAARGLGPAAPARAWRGLRRPIRVYKGAAGFQKGNCQ